jgi:hypothetical protein
MTDLGSYTCEGCGRTFEKTRSDAAAWAEAAGENWPGFPHDMGIACDDCYRGILWYEALTPARRSFWHRIAQSDAPIDVWHYFREHST